QVMLLADDPRPSRQMERFFYALAALAHHREYGGLEPRHVRQIAAKGTEILHAHGVDRQRSSLSYLHAELDAELAALAGGALEAARHTAAAVAAGRGGTTPEAGRHVAAMAAVAARLGAGERASALFAEAMRLEVRAERAEEIVVGE